MREQNETTVQRSREEGVGSRGGGEGARSLRLPKNETMNEGVKKGQVRSCSFVTSLPSKRSRARYVIYAVGVSSPSPLA